MQTDTATMFNEQSVCPWHYAEGTSKKIRVIYSRQQEVCKNHWGDWANSKEIIREQAAGDKTIMLL